MEAAGRRISIQTWLHLQPRIEHNKTESLLLNTPNETNQKKRKKGTSVKLTKLKDDENVASSK